VAEQRRATLVDANVLIDVMTDDQEWGTWSRGALADAADEGTLVINPIVYSEASIRFSSVEALDEALPADVYAREPLPWSAAFLAGKCFVEYRRRGGERRSPLPDFFIGAHAAVGGLVLLTRDATRYASYFPTVRLVSP